jgi:hypothetical protein
MVDAWNAFREACLSGCFVLAATVLLGLNCLGQNPIPAAQPGIQDNSFLVEEAYNQNFGVVQLISSFTCFWNSKRTGTTRSLKNGRSREMNATRSATLWRLCTLEAFAGPGLASQMFS